MLLWKYLSIRIWAISSESDYYWLGKRIRYLLENGIYNERGAKFYLVKFRIMINVVLNFQLNPSRNNELLISPALFISILQTASRYYYPVKGLPMYIAMRLKRLLLLPALPAVHIQHCNNLSIHQTMDDVIMTDSNGCEIRKLGCTLISSVYVVFVVSQLINQISHISSTMYVQCRTA